MINGGVHFTERGIMQNIRAMRMQSVLMSITNENVVGFDKVGYQKKIPVISSFAEFIGEQAISTTTDDTVGRLVKTNNPLDIALAEKGYTANRMRKEKILSEATMQRIRHSESITLIPVPFRVYAV